jgi:hypothetical protein
MKLELYGLIQSLLEAGGKFDYDMYVVRNGNGELHRDDGPAVICTDGTKKWYRNDKLHREDGPAVICTDGTLYWYRHGHRIYPTSPTPA